MKQLAKLVEPFDKRLIKQKGGSFAASYVAHSEVEQKLLATIGPHDFAVTEVLRGPDGKIEGCLARMAAVIDGEPVEIVEVGDCERPDNWKTEGARLKDAASDAYKRCAMRLGVGLHLWSQDMFWLDKYFKSE